LDILFDIHNFDWRVHHEIRSGRALIVSAGAVQAGGPVVVADDPVIAAPAAPASWDWTGLYAGLSATNGSFDNGTTDYDTSGFGIQVGYLRDLGRVV
jgi:hypothetical protein